MHILINTLSGMRYALIILHCLSMCVCVQNVLLVIVCADIRQTFALFSHGSPGGGH